MNRQQNYTLKLWSNCSIAICATIAISAMSPSVFASKQQSQRRISTVDKTGQWVEIEASANPILRTSDNLLAAGQSLGVIWHAIDDASITQSVCVSDTTNETWVGHNLNFHRLAYHQTTGDGTAIFDHDLPDNPSFVVVASAEDISLGVVLVHHASGGASVIAFNESNGNVPLWTYNFDNNFNFNNIRNLDVSAGGEVVIAAARDTIAGTSLVVLIDGKTGDQLNTLTVNAGILGVELSDSGTRAMLTELATARIIDTFTMNTMFSFAVSGAGGYHRLSRDGTTAVAGGFNCLAYREIKGIWTQVYSFAQANNWFGGGVALSANGDTLFMVSHNYATGYLTLTYRVIDLNNGIIIAQSITQGAGSSQDTVQQAQVSADGEVLAVISWGTDDNVHSEVQIFDRDLNLIGEIDTPGSPFSMDMSRNGQFVVVGGKAVHANTSGNGSDTYAFRVFSACPWDLDDNGTVGTSDLLGLFAQWGTAGSADFDGSGSVGTNDLLILFANWGPCP